MHKSAVTVVAISTVLSAVAIATLTAISMPAAKSEASNVADVTVTGTVYHDANGNGKRDANERGLEGWTLSLLWAERMGFPTNTAITNEQGEFTFAFNVAGLSKNIDRLLLTAVTPQEPRGAHWVTSSRGSRGSTVEDSVFVPARPGTYQVAFGKTLKAGARPTVVPDVRPRPGGAADSGRGGEEALFAEYEVASLLVIPVAIGLPLLMRSIRRRRLTWQQSMRLLVLVAGPYAVASSLAIVGLAGLSVKAEAAESNPQGGVAAPLFGTLIVKDDTGGSISGYLDDALENWEDAMGTDRYGQLWSSGDIHLWIVDVGEGGDWYLAYVKGIDDCSEEADNFGLRGYHAWEKNFDHIAYGYHDYGRICINHDYHLHGESPEAGFYYHPSVSARSRGVTHEIGHALYLDHDDDEGIMDMCWCYDINEDEAYLVYDSYN